MAIRNKIDSNETGLAIAKEVIGQPGVLPVTPVWVTMEPNEYDDFGGEPTLLARRPINSSRQRKKGSIVDLAANGGFNQDFTNENSKMLLSGFMYADFRNKLTGTPTEVTSTGYAFASTTPYVEGMILLASGFGVAANNGIKVVTGVETTEVEVSGLSVEAVVPPGAKLQLIGFEGEAGALDISTSGDLPVLTAAAGLDKFGLIPGEFIFIGGDGAGTSFTTAANNGIKRVKSVSATGIVIDKSDAPMVAESSSTETIQIFFGNVLKNELADKIVRQSFQLERAMGAPDTGTPTAFQAEYVLGAFPNELEMVIEAADKINCNYSFVAITNDHNTSSQGLKSGTRVATPESDAYNTSTDFSRIRLSLVNATNEAPSPLFAFITELTLSINNNVSLNKAVGYLGGFDATIGLFEVSAEINAYFTQVEAIQAVRQNRDVTLDFFVVKENKGVVADLPLVALGGGLAEVEIDEPIMIPLESDAATAVKLDPNMDHTLMWTYFDYLPNRASA
jgi:hypothetical protein